MSDLQLLKMQLDALDEQVAKAKRDAIAQAQVLVERYKLRSYEVYGRAPFELRRINRFEWKRGPPKPLSEADLADQSPNGKLRRVFAQSGLSYDGALYYVNKRLQTPYSYSAWRSWLARPGASNFLRTNWEFVSFVEEALREAP